MDEIPLGARLVFVPLPTMIAIGFALVADIIRRGTTGCHLAVSGWTAAMRRPDDPDPRVAGEGPDPCVTGEGPDPCVTGEAADPVRGHGGRPPLRHRGHQARGPRSGSRGLRCGRPADARRHAVAHQGEVRELRLGQHRYRVVVVSSDAYNVAEPAVLVAPLRRRAADVPPYLIAMADQDPVGGTVDVGLLAHVEQPALGEVVGILTGATMARVRDALHVLFQG
jgi:mRNA interferase MazF